MTAEEIYHSIRSRSVTMEIGIKLIENYGIQNQRTAIEKMQKEYPVTCSEEIENIIKRITAKLDELFEITAEACKRK